MISSRFEAGIAVGVALWMVTAGGASRAADVAPLSEAGQDQPKLELVMKIVVTCASPEAVAPTSASKDGQRQEIWPILGGRFFGKDIRGTVVAGGGDFPVTRPDGVEVIDALYRLRTDDGVTIIIHNKGLAYPARSSKTRDTGWCRSSSRRRASTIGSTGTCSYRRWSYRCRPGCSSRKGRTRTIG